MPLGTWGVFPSFPTRPLPASQDEALWIISTITISPFIRMEKPAPIMSSNSPDHATDPSAAARSARDLDTSAATVGHTSVQDARSGGQDIQPLTAPSPTKKHGRHGKGQRSGRRRWKNGGWTRRHARRDGPMPSKPGKESPTSRMKHGGPQHPLHPRRPPSPTTLTSSANSAVRRPALPSFSLWTSLMSVTSNIKWGVMI